MQVILHFILMPLKIVLFCIVSRCHCLFQSYKYKESVGNNLPHHSSVNAQYKELCKYVDKHIDHHDEGDTYKVKAHLSGVHNDHQALRHGSLVWSMPTTQLVRGSLRYINEDFRFLRGVGMTDEAPPAMPMSVAFSLAVGIKEGMEPHLDGCLKFVFAVNQLIENNFELASSSMRCRAVSTGFDKLYVDSLLWTAWRLTGNGRYLSIIRRTNITHGPLLLAPITWFRTRNYFIDHISMFGLWTCYQMSDGDAAYKALYRHAMRFVWSQSSIFANPYFTALAYECGAINDMERDRVLRANPCPSLIDMCAIREEQIYSRVVPCDWTNEAGNEFRFDTMPEGQTVFSVKQNGMNYLNGLCYGKSLMTLMS